MLKLQRLEISGFKSFPDPVSTEFATGITAIVGPNGCGKSNLSEAITWVLGEQSAKSLRGGRMEDVIFSGSDRRKPLGMAEVSLTLATDEPLEESVDGRITIGRRVFRSGESLYRLNDKVVRLKDVKDLLMDTGLGIRAYSVIGQGQIGQVLSTKPLERRKLIEEAAGVTRYRQRKRLAELKLEEATANRMRLDDIIAEVERALRSLKRQSSAARRYKKRQREKRDVLRRVLVARYARLRTDLDRIERELAAAGDRDAAAVAGLSTAEAELASIRHQLDRLTGELAVHNRRSGELDARIEGRQQLVRGSRRTLEEIAERLENGAQLAAQRERERESYVLALEAITGRRDQLAGERDQVAAAVTEGEARILEAEERLRVTEAAVESARSELMASLGRIQTLQSKLHRTQIDQEKAHYRESRLAQEREAKEREIAEAAHELEAASTRVGALEDGIAESAELHAGHRRELDTLLRREAEANKARQELREEQTELTHRRALLEELAAAEEERRSSLRDALAEVGIDDAPFLDEIAAAPEGWEDGVDLFLEHLGDAIVTPADEDPLMLARAIAAAGIEGTVLAPAEATGAGAPADLYARAQRPKRPSRTPQRPVAPAPAPAAASEPPPPRGLLRRIAERLGLARRPAAPEQLSLIDRAEEREPAREPAPEPPPEEPAAEPRPPGLERLADRLGLPAELAAALPPAYLVESPEEAQRLAAGFPGVAFVTRQRFWALGGALRVQGGEVRPGTLGRTRELDEIEEALPRIETGIESLADDLEGLVAARTERARDANQLENRLAELRQQHAVAQARRQDTVNRRERLDAELQAMAGEQREIAEELERCGALQAELQQELEGCEREHRELETRFDAAESELAQTRQRREAVRTEGASRKGQLHLLIERYEAQEHENRRLAEQQETVERALAQWRIDRARLEEKRVELEATISTAEEELRAALEAQGAAGLERRATEEQLGARRTAVHQAEARVAEARAGREATREALESLRIERAGSDREAQHALAAYRAEFKEDLPVERIPGLAPVVAPRFGATAHEEPRAERPSKPRAERPSKHGAERPSKHGAERPPDQAAAATEGGIVLLWNANRALPPVPAAVMEPEDARDADEDAPPRAAEPDPFSEIAYDIESLDQLEERLADLEAQLERLGPVNLLAADELDEQEERHRFLVEQRADVQQSIESLRRTIREINQTSHARFTETFAVVNENFARTFARLFRGGEASMRLLDEEDPLESGIEIVARPPGKRLQNIQLLSGGEKALTAIALLFALFQAKPSPFCILDEVDAPLDDANVLRFIDLLEEMSAETQFLVVTHNKLTMLAASSLYGVTMQEKGVTTLVGVEVDDLHPRQQIAS
ncbi:MAG TPA: AAA family ATPase [Thermoanaerobaculia bacterium]|nr:AAA family ATPase [Thermoanaerobaculia bacterium]